MIWSILAQLCWLGLDILSVLRQSQREQAGSCTGLVLSIEHPGAQEVEVCPTVHLTFEQFQAVDVAFDTAIQINRQLYPMHWKNLMNLR
jgi:hypothetical protein